MNESLILTLCLQENTLLISNAIIEQLGSPALIQIRINESDKSLLVNPCEYGVRGAVVVPENRMYQMEMPDRSLIRRIRRITEWPDDNPRVLYGVFIPSHNAIYFSMDTAQYAILQPAPDAQDKNATDETRSSALPTREGPEAAAQPLADESEIETGETMDYHGATKAPAGGEDGDLNG